MQKRLWVPAIVVVLSLASWGCSSGADQFEYGGWTGQKDAGSGQDGSAIEDASSDADGDADGDASIEVVITADNAYGFGYGTDNGLANYFGGMEAITAGEIFNCGEGPETYDIPPSAAAGATYLYIVAYADHSVTQGVIGQFRRVGGGVANFGDLITTGDENWEVCAVGVDYDPGSGGPDRETIDAAIVQCNDGSSMDPMTTSMGWVDSVGTTYGALVIGEDNSTPYNNDMPENGNEFRVVCTDELDRQARWMWFNWDPQNIVWPDQSPFMWPGGTNPDHEFLIFRLAAAVIPPIE